MNELLFDIQFKHNYFSEGVLQDCQVIADDNTLKNIDRFKLMTRMESGVFSLYSTMATEAIEFVTYINNLLQNEPFRFYLIYKADGFNLATKVPFDWVGQFDINSNDKTTVGDKTNNSFDLIPSLAKRTIYNDAAIAVISIFPDDLLSSGGVQVHYLVNFEARKTYWLYYLINRSQIKLNEPLISNEQGIHFDSPEKMIMPNGEAALSFNSGQTEFLMQESPNETFNLVDKLRPSMHDSGQTIEKIIIKGLPTPQNDQLNIININGMQRIYSEMYVYL